LRLKALGTVLLAGLVLTAAAQDRRRSAIDVVYDDVQVLKQQVKDLQDRLDRNAEEIAAIREQLRIIGDLLRQSASDQAGLRESLRSVPAQYQDLVRRIDQLTLELQRISAELAAVRAPEPPPSAPEEKPKGKASGEPPPKKAPEPKSQTAQPPPAPPVPAVSPQESYAAAYNDFLRGNYDLAVQSFKLYRQQFPTSPLADNALYWIGECHFSQRKFVEAIDAFDELILTYPQGDKAAAAYLKKGLSFVELGKKDEALAALKILVAKYPLEEESRIAQDKIKELTQK
jgi:tol-pal system protein YbgF